MRRIGRAVYLAIGWATLALGIIGVFLPVLPTAPFILLAVWAFANSSPALAERIRSHPIAGNYVKDWEAEQVIPLKGKVLAVSSMAATLIYLFLFSGVPGWASGAAAAVMVAVASFIMSRPSQRS